MAIKSPGWRAVAAALICGSSASGALAAGHCPEYQPDRLGIYWGDLHVHTAYSLDAWGYGTQRTPADAYAYARGEGERSLDRPLDFVAVTDHAEWFDLLYLCTEPGGSDHPSCLDLRKKNNATEGGELFRDYVVPSITGPAPQSLALCVDHPAQCADAAAKQWQRVQAQANAANTPCEFTSLIGFEWSATPDFSHTHRNVIFASDRVVPRAIDYLHYPTLDALWSTLDAGCREEDGCAAVTIAHNSNMGDGKSFEVETEDERLWRLRARYERLAEIHQEKGNSECLPPANATDAADCDFEISLTKRSRPANASDFTADEWQRMRSSYLRSLLLTGLKHAQTERALNPLQLGFVGSTDGHNAQPGDVEDEAWGGSVFGHGSFEQHMQRLAWNPGGLVAALAFENTREGIFEALHSRRVYATSGPRIRLSFTASQQPQTPSCDDHELNAVGMTQMGAELSTSAMPTFRVAALKDQAPLASMEVIKGVYREGQLIEQIVPVWHAAGGAASACQIWQDTDFRSDEPAFWYARIKQVPTPRWSKLDCIQAGRCSEFPGAERDVEERAWSSPIWFLPEPAHEN